MASKLLVRKIGRVELMKVSLKPHKLAPQKRDIFEKKFGWCYRPPVNPDSRDFNQSIISNESPRKNYSTRSDQIENYFYFTSMDSKESKLECPDEPDTVRTHVYFGMHKFEFITRLKKNQNIFTQVSGTEGAIEDSFALDEAKPQFETCVKLTMLLQCDPKLSKLKFAIYRAALPTFTKQFYNDLSRFLEHNHI